MKKTFFYFLICFFAHQTVLALSPLPKNSYLRLGDNQKEVKILQEILNSDPDTQIATTGVGSPGNENWYFGSKTETALKKFQNKNNLEATGRIDFKTLKILNNYVSSAYPKTSQLPASTNISKTNTSTNQKILDADEKRKQINEQNKKDFEEAKKNKLKEESERSQELENSSKSYIQDLVDKYTGFFYTQKKDSENTKPTNTTTTQNPQDTFSNTYSSQTPYLNPSTGIYSSNPSYANQTQPQQTPGNPFLSPTPNPYINYSPQALPQYFGQQPTGAPTPMNQPTYNGTVGGALPAKFKILPNGWLAGPTTHFGTEWNGSRDAAPGSNCTAAMNPSINICSVSTCIVSLPIAAQVYFWGNEQQKAIIGSLLGRSANAQYKALGWSYNRIKGSPIEIYNPATGRCTVAPIWETGPGDTEGGAIDLTPCIKKAIGPSTNFISHFRPVPAGKRGCEDYNYTPSLVK